MKIGKGSNVMKIAVTDYMRWGRLPHPILSPQWGEGYGHVTPGLTRRVLGRFWPLAGGSQVSTPSATPITHDELSHLLDTESLTYWDLLTLFIETSMQVHPSE